MQEDKIYPATPRKLRKARRKGQVAYSQELTVAGALTVAFAALWACGPWLWGRLRTLMREQFAGLDAGAEPTEVMGEAFAPMVAPLLLLFGIFMLFVMVLPFLQRGWLWAWPKKRKKGGRRVVYPVLKGGVVALMGWIWLSRQWEGDLNSLFSQTMGLGLCVSLGLLLMALGDFFYQKHAFAKEMRMTSQEVKEEAKEEQIARKR